MKNVVLLAILIATFCSCNSISSSCSLYEGVWINNSVGGVSTMSIKQNGDNFTVTFSNSNVKGDWAAKCENNEVVIAGSTGKWTIGYDKETNECFVFGQRFHKEN